MRLRLQAIAYVIAAAVLPGACGACSTDVDPEPGPLWRYSGALEVFDASPCDDWIAGFLPRAPPENPDVRVLWRWHPYGDPVYAETGLANQYLGAFAVGPDGTIFAVGPEQDRLEALESTGTLRWISHPHGGNFNRSIAVAPDGTAYAVLRVTETRARLVRASPTGIVGELGLPLEGDSADDLVVGLGPQGRVYVSSATSVYATCRGQRLEWVLRFDGPAAGRTRVEASGDIWLSGGEERAIRLSAAGEILESVPPEPIPSVGVGLLAHGATRVWRWRDLDSEEWWVSLQIDGRPTVDLPRQRRYTDYALDGENGIWFREPIGDTMQGRWGRYEGDRLLWTRDGLSYVGLSSSGIGSDGSVLVRGMGDELGTITRLAPDGTVIASVPLTNPGEDALVPGTILLDTDGIAYIAADRDFNHYLIAVQTDMIPPSNACVQHGCGPTQGFWEMR